jgi:hypothetical protein
MSRLKMAPMDECDLDELTASFSAMYFMPEPTQPAEVGTDTAKTCLQSDEAECVDDAQNKTVLPELRRDLPIPLIRASADASIDTRDRETGVARLTRAIVETLMRDGEVIVSQEYADRRRVYEILNIIEWLGLVQKEKQGIPAGLTGKASSGRPGCAYRFVGDRDSPNVDIRHLAADIARLRKRIEEAESEPETHQRPIPKGCIEVDQQKIDE